MTKPSTRDRLTGLLATLGLAAVVVGLPVVLVAISSVVGVNPIPSNMPAWAEIETSLTSPDDGSLALGAIVLIAWLVWAFMALSILLEIGAQLRGLRAPRLPGLRLPQSAARSLVGTAALLFIAAPLTIQVTSEPATSATATPVAYTAPATAGITTEVSQLEQQVVHTVAGSEADRPEKPAKTMPHPVGPGETLWSIAKTHLGDGARYPEIAALNADRLGGRPGFLEVGWVLQVPDAQPDNQPDRGPGAHEDGTYTVGPGETLSEIALTELDDASAYPQIFKASRDIVQPGGAHLSDPDVIDIGWTLQIPTAPGENKPGENEPGGPGHSGQQHGQPGGGDQTPDDTTPADPPTDPPPDEPPESEAPEESAPAEPDTQVPSASEETKQEGAESSLDAPWLLAGLTGGGVILSGALLLALRARRRTQFRTRRPGRSIAGPGPELAPVEMTINTTGARAAATVEFMDEALRRLAGSCASAGRPLPRLAAVELVAEGMVLHLTDPVNLDAPWEGTSDSLHWRCPVDLDAIGADEDSPAPYPMLVTIGSTEAGEVWLLNCEEMATLTIDGDSTYSRDFARYLTAELAMNPWSAGIQVDCVGIAEEIAPMERDRIRYHQPGQDGTTAAAEILADAVATIERTQAYNADVATGRGTQLSDDVWPARVLLVDAATDQPQVLDQLLRLVDDHAGYTGTSVVVTGDRESKPGTVLHMTSTGRVQLADAGLDLIAVGLTSDEAHGCAALLAQSDDLDDVEIPIDETAAEGWEAYANQAGGLRAEHTLSRHLDTYDEPAESILDGADDDYVRVAAATAEDLANLAPQVSLRVRDEIEAADPALDADLADWFDVDCQRPRLTLLGPVGARTQGKPREKRKAYFVELLAYLALRRRYGVTAEEVAEAFNIAPTTVRTRINELRDWLGHHPATGDSYLPDARKAPASQSRGINVYQVDDGLLIDADLFRRLRARAETRGPAGIEDLHQALALVTGRPFDKLRADGWTWFLQGDRLDHQMQCAVGDVAHLVTIYSLERRDLERARVAVEKARIADPDADTTQLNRAALAAAEGFPEEADRILRDEVCNRSDDGQAPLDLSERTASIIRTHDWLATG
ncbi:MAG: LysM peptidoglycan-binding domain-containing protein [Nocardioides sp.]